MEFIITRTSQGHSQDPPCEGTTPKTVPSNLMDGDGNPTKETVHVIDFPDLASLMAFIATRGERKVVILPYIYKPQLWELEIYDDYRE